MAHCTIRVNVPDWLLPFAVALTDIVVVPFGVIGPPPPPPQPESPAAPNAPRIERAKTVMAHQSLPPNRLLLRRRAARPPKPRNAMAKSGAEPVCIGWPNGTPGLRSDDVFTSVATVSLQETAVLVPSGVRVDGEKVQVAYAGSPEQAKLICWLNPPTGVTVSVVELLDPCVTVNVEGLKLMVNAGIWAAGWPKISKAAPETPVPPPGCPAEFAINTSKLMALAEFV